MPLEILGGRPMIWLKVNGAGPFRFLIDPWASESKLDVRLIEELRLRTSSARGARPSAPDSRIVDVEIEGVPVPRVEMRPVDMVSVVPEFGAATRPRGIVGSSLGVGQLLTIDYPAWRVGFASGTLPDPNGRDVFTLDTQTSRLALTVTVAGIPIPCEIDLLSTTGLLLPESYAKTLPLVKTSIASVTTPTRHGVIVAREAELAGNVALGGAVFERPIVQFSPQTLVPIVGTAWLNDFAVIFDLPNRRVRLTPRRRS